MGTAARRNEQAPAAVKHYDRMMAGRQPHGGGSL